MASDIALVVALVRQCSDAFSKRTKKKYLPRLEAITIPKSFFVQLTTSTRYVELSNGRRSILLDRLALRRELRYLNE